MATDSNLVHAVSHISGDEAWTVRVCGGGIGLVNSRGWWLALDSNTTGTGALIAKVFTVNQTAVNRSDPHSPGAFQLPPAVLFNNSGTDEAVMLVSAVPSLKTGTGWVVAVEAGFGGESLLAVAVTPEQATNTSAYDESAVWFHVRLQDHCEDNGV